MGLGNLVSKNKALAAKWLRLFGIRSFEVSMICIRMGGTPTPRVEFLVLLLRKISKGLPSFDSILSLHVGDY